MNYHNITKCDMNNGAGFRVVLWVAGCTHHCKNCQNPSTWDVNGGIPFDDDAISEIFEELNKDYIQGITFSGGDPLNDNNVEKINEIIDIIKEKYPNKTLWIYSGYTYDELKENAKLDSKIDKLRLEVVEKCDVFVDGKYVDSLRDVNLPWRGSSNQIVWDMKTKEIIPDKVEEVFHDVDDKLTCCQNN